MCKESQWWLLTEICRDQLTVINSDIWASNFNEQCLEEKRIKIIAWIKLHLWIPSHTLIEIAFQLLIYLFSATNCGPLWSNESNDNISTRVTNYFSHSLSRDTGTWLYLYYSQKVTTFLFDHSSNMVYPIDQLLLES